MGSSRSGGPAARVSLDAARQRAAFSLVELVVVIAVISIIGAIVVPRYGRGLARYGADAAAARIASDIGQTAALARAASQSREIRFRPTQGEYAVTGARSLTDNASAYVVDLRVSEYGVYMEMADCGGDTTLVFDGFGAADSAATLVIHRGDEARRIDLDAVSGRVTISRLSPAGFTTLIQNAAPEVLRGWGG
jgi:prepilin-type N-terminal cleavage/methylation domain-containing protein